MRASIHVGVIGCGTVGSGVVRILMQEKELIARRLGASIELTQIADIDPNRYQALNLPETLFTTDANQLIHHPKIDIVVELMGGINPARQFILTAIENGKHVVTANKALLALHGEEIFKAAEKQKIDIGFEASVGGGIPILRAIREGFSGEKISAIFGIVNGTCNYILTKMSEEGGDFSAVLKEAQALGYAESDPTLDIGGGDSAHKLAILASLAFGTPVPVKEVYTEGIDHLTALDLSFAETLGYKMKLLAITKLSHGELQIRVHPTLIAKDEILAKVNGVFNAIYIRGESVGESLFYGRGAGSMPTGSAVVSDIIDISRNILHGSTTRTPPLGYLPSQRVTLPIQPMEETVCCYYLRFRVEDRHGVLAEIAGVLGEHQISIASVIQQGGKGAEGADAGQGVHLVMMTHQAIEKDIQAALTKINRSSFVFEPTVLIRVEAKIN